MSRIVTVPATAISYYSYACFLTTILVHCANLSASMSMIMTIFMLVLLFLLFVEILLLPSLFF